MERAGDLLESFLKLHNISGGEEYVAFFKSWHRIVGTDIASHTRVTDIKNGALKVEVDHPGWMQKLQMKKEQVLQRVASQYPQLEIRTLHLRLVSSVNTSSSESSSGGSSQHPAGATEPSDERRRRESSPETTHTDASRGQAAEHEVSKNAKQALNRIEDDNLKSTLSRLYEDLKDNDAD